MKVYSFVFLEDNILQEVKLKAKTEREAIRLFSLLIKSDLSEIKEIKCLEGQ